VAGRGRLPLGQPSWRHGRGAGSSTVVVAPGTAVVPAPNTPLMCPSINASDPRQC
jgi:hypothetical protein